MRHPLSLVLIAGLTAAASAQTTSSSVAALTGTIQPGGPRTGANGDSFFNIEGAGNGSFASYGVARWDLTALRASFDAAYGAGNWHITNVELQLAQSNAAFSHVGSVNLYYTTDDTTDIKTAAGGLTYPFFDPITNAPDMPLGNAGNAILAYTFNPVGATFGTFDRYTPTGSIQTVTGVPGTPNPGEALIVPADMLAHITSQNALTLVFVETDPAIAATYRGQVVNPADPTVVGPNLFITAAANTAGCYANCDSSTTAPVLNVLDFSCFLNRFAAGETYANCDASTTPPVLNVLDFSCFLNKFAAGCP